MQEDSRSADAGKREETMHTTQHMVGWQRQATGVAASGNGALRGPPMGAGSLAAGGCTLHRRAHRLHALAHGTVRLPVRGLAGRAAVAHAAARGAAFEASFGGAAGRVGADAGRGLPQSGYDESTQA